MNFDVKVKKILKETFSPYTIRQRRAMEGADMLIKIAKPAVHVFSDIDPRNLDQDSGKRIKELYKSWPRVLKKDVVARLQEMDTGPISSWPGVAHAQVMYRFVKLEQEAIQYILRVIKKGGRDVLGQW